MLYTVTTETITPVCGPIYLSVLSTEKSTFKNGLTAMKLNVGGDIYAPNNKVALRIDATIGPLCVADLLFFNDEYYIRVLSNKFSNDHIISYDYVRSIENEWYIKVSDWLNACGFPIRKIELNAIITGVYVKQSVFTNTCTISSMMFTQYGDGLKARFSNAMNPFPRSENWTPNQIIHFKK